MGAEDVGDARIEATPKQGHNAALREAFAIGPLPAVFESGNIRRLVVGGVEVIDAGFEAGVHDGQVLVRERDVQHEVRLHLAD